MDRANSFTAAILLAACCATHAGVGVPPTVGPVPWLAESYTARLPPPFGSVNILLTVEEGRPVALRASFDGRVIEASIEQLEDLEEPTVDSVSYAPADDEHNEAKYISLIVLTGDSYNVRNKPCENLHDFTWERDVANFRIDTDGRMTREMVSFRQMDACGT